MKSPRPIDLALVLLLAGCDPGKDSNPGDSSTGEPCSLMCQPAPESMLYRNMCIDGKVWAVQEAGSQCLNYADAQLTRVWIGPYSEDCN